MPRRGRSTPEGEHRPVMLAEVLAALDPKPGEIAVDCTLGRGGHAAELLRWIGPSGRLIAFDLDSANLETARDRLCAVGENFALHHGNFAAIAATLAAETVRADVVLADLGMSSMQVDQSERGFSFVRDGPLDMRMDPTRGARPGNYWRPFRKRNWPRRSANLATNRKPTASLQPLSQREKVRRRGARSNWPT